MATENPTPPDDTPTDDHLWWCPLCKERRELTPHPGRCPECGSVVVLKKMDQEE